VLPFRSMIHLLILAVHLLATIAKLVRPGGVRVVVAESLLIKHQLLISSRSLRRVPNLNSFDRFVLGLGSLFVPASRIPKLAVILKPRTSTRSSSSSAAIPVLVVPASHRRLRVPLASISTRTSSAACSRTTIDPKQEPMARLLAEFYRAYEGQPVERRFVSLRIDTLAQPLGHGGDGRVHTSDHWLWR
jgi:hypothetical protein